MHTYLPTYLLFDIFSMFYVQNIISTSTSKILILKKQLFEVSNFNRVPIFFSFVFLFDYFFSSLVGTYRPLLSKDYSESLCDSTSLPYLRMVLYYLYLVCLNESILFSVSVFFNSSFACLSKSVYSSFSLLFSLSSISFKNGQFRGSLLIYFRLCNTVFTTFESIADDWIRTDDLWFRKWQLYQLRHNHCLCLFFLSLSLSLWLTYFLWIRSPPDNDNH